MKFSLRLRINNLMSPATHDRHWRLRSHLSLERVTTRADRRRGEYPHAARTRAAEATRPRARARPREQAGPAAPARAGAGARDPRRGAGTGSLCSPAAVLVTAGRVAPPAGTHPEQQVHACAPVGMHAGCSHRWFFFSFFACHILVRVARPPMADTPPRLDPNLFLV